MARRGAGTGWFLLGLVVGGAAGALLRLLLAPTPGSRTQPGASTGGDGDTVAASLTQGMDHLRALGNRARAAFVQGRASALEAGHAARHATEEAAGSARKSAAHAQAAATETAGAVTTRVTGTVQGFTGGLKARWREAIDEGRQAAADKEAELRRRYIELTQRVPDEP